MPDNDTGPSRWTDRVWREFHAGNLTRSARDVLLTLRTYRWKGGLIAPSHATLAGRARCGVRTVRRALAAGADLGLVSWTERRVRAGWRWLRTSNAYCLRQPDGPVQPGLRSRRALPCTTGQTGRGGESRSKKSCFEALLRAAASAPDLLLARRQSFAARLR